MISLPSSVFPQIRQVPPRSEIWHKDLKFQRAKKRSVISLSLFSLLVFSHTDCSFHTDTYLALESLHNMLLIKSLLSPVQEGVSKRVEFAKRLVGVYNKGVPRDDSLHLPVHDGSEAVSGGFRSHPASRNILLQ